MGLRWCESNVKIVNNLGNAVDMNNIYPNLNIPNIQQIEEILPDDRVELTHNGDRFWVVIDDVIEPDEFIGLIETDLQFDHPFETGDCILFDVCNILNLNSREWKDGDRISKNI